jgi:MFS family permease
MVVPIADLDPPAGPKMTAWLGQYKWRVVGYLWLVCFLNYVDRSSIFALFPLLRQEFSLTGTELGLIGSVFLWVYSASSPVAGLFGDRFARKNVVLASLGIWSAITCLTGMVRSASQLLFCRGLMGLAEAAYFPAALALLSDYHSRQTRSTAISVHQSGLYIGYLGGGALAGILAERYGWRFPFYVFGAVGIAALALFGKVLKEAPRGIAEEAGLPSRKQAIQETLCDLIACPTAVALAVVHFGVLSVAWIIFAWAPYFIHEKFQSSLAMAAVQSTTALQIPSVIGILTGGAIADRLMRRGIHGRMATLVAGLALGAPFLVLLGWGNGLYLALGGLIGFGFFKGFFDGNGPPAIYDVVHPDSRSSAYGIFNSISGLSSGFAVLLVGALKDRIGLGNLLASLAIIYVLSAAILWFATLRYLQRDLEKLAVQIP